MNNVQHPFFGGFDAFETLTIPPLAAWLIKVCTVDYVASFLKDATPGLKYG